MFLDLEKNNIPDLKGRLLVYCSCNNNLGESVKLASISLRNHSEVMTSNLFNFDVDPLAEKIIRDSVSGLETVIVSLRATSGSHTSMNNGSIMLTAHDRLLTPNPLIDTVAILPQGYNIDALNLINRAYFYAYTLQLAHKGVFNKPIKGSLIQNPEGIPQIMEYLSNELILSKDLKKSKPLKSRVKIISKDTRLEGIAKEYVSLVESSYNMDPIKRTKLLHLISNKMYLIGSEKYEKIKDTQSKIEQVLAE